MCLDARLLPQSYQYLNLSEGADRISGQQRGDKECPFSGVTKSGRVWKKVPERDARRGRGLVFSCSDCATKYCRMLPGMLIPVRRECTERLS